MATVMCTFIGELAVIRLLHNGVEVSEVVAALAEGKGLILHSSLAFCCSSCLLELVP